MCFTSFSTYMLAYQLWGPDIFRPTSLKHCGCGSRSKTLTPLTSCVLQNECSCDYWWEKISWQSVMLCLAQTLGVRISMFHVSMLMWGQQNSCVAASVDSRLCIQQLTTPQGHLFSSSATLLEEQPQWIRGCLERLKSHSLWCITSVRCSLPAWLLFPPN